MGYVHIASVQQNLGFTKVDFLNLALPALMAEGSVSSDTTLEKPSPLLTVPGKPLLLQPFTVLSTDACIQGVLEDVAGLVTHWLQFGLDVGRRIFEVLPEVLKWHVSCPVQPGHIQRVFLHLNPVFNTLVLVKTTGDHTWKIHC